jgi:hypothetical protein
MPQFTPVDGSDQAVVKKDDSGLDPEYVKARSNWIRPGDKKKIDMRGAVGKLENLGFDPIETMVRKYDEIQGLIDAILLSKRPSMIAVVQLMGHQQKIAEKLMDYGYAKVPANLPPEPDENDSGGFLEIVYESESQSEPENVAPEKNGAELSNESPAGISP